MAFMTARLRRLFGAGLMLFLLHGLALSAVALAVGHFHQRMQLLVEPVELPLLRECASSDVAARLHAAELLLARAGALDDWQPVYWLVGAALLSSLLGAMLVNLHWLRWVKGQQRRRSAALLGLHLLALGLAAQLLRLYEEVWAGLAIRLPMVCMAGPTALPESGAVMDHRLLPRLLADAGLTSPQSPDALALASGAVLVTAMALGVWLWRTVPLPTGD